MPLVLASFKSPDGLRKPNYTLFLGSNSLCTMAVLHKTFFGLPMDNIFFNLMRLSMKNFDQILGFHFLDRPLIENSRNEANDQLEAPL